MMEATELVPLDTYFAPAGRDTPIEFSRTVATVAEAPLLCAALNAVSGMVLVLNHKRQIVAANEAALRILKTNLTDLLSVRPGEAVGCIRAHEGPDGCGTARHCRMCGAAQAILGSLQQNGPVVRECRILTDGPAGVTPLDLKVSVRPITLEGVLLLVVAMEDISHAKRLAVLQRVFFHDVLNTVSCILGYADCLRDMPELPEEVCDGLMQVIQRLTEEIQTQRDLVAAESGDLRPQVESIGTGSLLEELREQYLQSPVATDRTITLRNVWEGIISTDRRLLMRVVGNMLKNALEATAPGQAVSLDCLDGGSAVTFAVHNIEVMPEDVQHQVFLRSFSTKGQPGRGVGTYSMKLFGEQYLGGKVGFSSEPSEGTTFWLTLPKQRSVAS
jgi:signal transduction histidine kinase